MADAARSIAGGVGSSLEDLRSDVGRRRLSVRGGRRHSAATLPPENSTAHNEIDGGGGPSETMADSQGRPGDGGYVDGHDDEAEGEDKSSEDMLFMSGDALKGTMLNACNALRALKNVLEASRLSSPGTGSAPTKANKVPWPVSMLYGSGRYASDGEEGDGNAVESVAAEWPVDLFLVDSVVQLLVVASAFNAIQTVSSGGWRRI